MANRFFPVKKGFFPENKYTIFDCIKRAGWVKVFLMLQYEGNGDEKVK